MIEYILIFWATYFIGFFAAYVISERLVVPFGLFDVKVFNCRKCCTHWILTALYGSVSLAMGSWILFICGMIITFAQSYCFYYTEKEKGL